MNKMHPVYDHMFVVKMSKEEKDFAMENIKDRSGVHDISLRDSLGDFFPRVS